MTILIAILLGVVEGLTEFLPVSSTGHLILVSHWLKATDESAKSFDIVIQLGAILAVVVHYRALLASNLRGLLAQRPASLRLFAALLVAFVPAALAGLLFGKTIKQHLFGPLPVAGALLVGGVLMIGVERWQKAKGLSGAAGRQEVTLKDALAIGFGQCFALWPGASRSMTTIVSGQLCGLSTRAAAEFSFLLALPTLGAATLYEGYKARHELGHGGWLELAVGMTVSFLVALLVISAFLRYLSRRGLGVFGYYRIALGLLVIFLVR